MRAVLLNFPELDAYGQMALDEALLDSNPRDAMHLRFYRWQGAVMDPGKDQIPWAVTFGYFQKYEDVVEAVRSRKLSLTFPLVRRPTGGGIVYHDGDITFSLIFPWGRLETASWVYKNLHRGVHLGLKALGLRSNLWSPPRSLGAGRAMAVVPQAVCFAEPSPMDLIAEDGKKVLGGALRRRKGVGLYQGSMRPEGYAATRDRLMQAIVEGISLEWKALFQQEEVPNKIMSAAEELRRSRYMTDSWNRRR